jgi:hypothetical protein
MGTSFLASKYPHWRKMTKALNSPSLALASTVYRSISWARRFPRPPCQLHTMDMCCFPADVFTQEGLAQLHSSSSISIWVNYNNSLTWNKTILGYFPLLTSIPVRSQWGRCNLPRSVWFRKLNPLESHRPINLQHLRSRYTQYPLGM